MAPKAGGLLKGLSVTFKELTKTVTKGAATVQYPHEKEAPPIRARGVIALKEENCTVCMLCARSCPDWCIYIEGHKEKAPPRRAGGKPRTVSKLDRFDIDYALCIVTRYRENLTAGLDPERSVIRAIDTAGRAVLFAGTTVVISVLGLLLMRTSIMRGVAIGIFALRHRTRLLTLGPAGEVGQQLEQAVRRRRQRDVLGQDVAQDLAAHLHRMGGAEQRDDLVDQAQIVFGEDAEGIADDIVEASA